MIRAVIFDMDGVLIDAKDWHYLALNRALDKFGLAIDREEHLATFDGLPTKEKLEILSRTRGLPRSLHPFINELKQEYTSEVVESKCRPVFQHRYALQRLQAEGYQLGLCSNAVRRSVDRMMRLAKLDGFMSVTLSNEDVREPKPSPEIYNSAMERLGVRADETVVLEDNEHGIRAAVASGAYVIRVGTVDDVTYDLVRLGITEATSQQMRTA